MTEKIVILGTRTLAEHMADVTSEIPGCEVTAFVENMDRERCSEKLMGLPVIWVDELADLANSHMAVCGLATTHRKMFTDQVSAMGMKFATLSHPTAWVSSTAKLGTGCFLNVNAMVATQTVLGNHVMVNRGASIGHHTNIGDYVTIQPGVNIAGLVNIGDHTYVGMGAVVLDNITIGKGCIIGAGAVVTKDLPDAVQVVGVPAKIVKTDVEGK